MTNSVARKRVQPKRQDTFAKDWQVERPPRRHEPPPGLVLSTIPTIRGRAAAHRWINDVLGVPVSLNFVRAASNRREIPCTKMSGALLFSTRALFDWIMTCADEAAS